MLKKSFATVSTSLLVLQLSACAGIQVPDKPVCVELSPSRANCVDIVSGKDFDIDETHLFEGHTWWETRPAMIMVPVSTWASLKKFIIDICKQTNQCQSVITNWQRSVDTIDGKLDEKLDEKQDTLEP